MFRRRLALGNPRTVGGYFTLKFKILLSNFDDDELAEVDLDTEVGRLCQRLMDRVVVVVKEFDLERMNNESMQLIESTVKLMQIWYYG